MKHNSDGYEPNKLHDRFICECLDSNYKLTNKELEQVKALADLLEIQALSEKQAYQLNKLNQKAVFG